MREQIIEEDVENSISESKSLLETNSLHLEPSLNKNISAILFRKSLPIILQSFLYAVGGFVRLKLLSNLSRQEFSGANLVIGIESFVFSPIISIFNQSAVFTAKQYGQIKIIKSTEHHDINTLNNANQEIGNILRQTWMLCIGGGIITIILIPITLSVMGCFNISEDITNSAKSYLYPFMLSIPLSLILFANYEFMISVNKQIWLIPFTIISVGFGIIFDLYLIQSFDNISGAAWSDVAQSIANLLVFLLFFYFKKDLKPYKIFTCAQLNTFTHARNIIQQTWPSSIKNIIFGIKDLIIKALISKYGKVGLVMDSVAKFFFGTIRDCISLAFCAVGTRMVAQTMGSAKFSNSVAIFKDAKSSGNLNLLFPLIAQGGLSVIIFSFYKDLSYFLMNKNDVDSYRQLLMHIFIGCGLESFFDVLRISLTSNLYALEDTFLASSMSILTTLVITFPLAFSFVYGLHLEQYSIYLSTALGYLISAIPVAMKWMYVSSNMIRDLGYDPEFSSSNAWIRKSLTDTKIKFQKHYSRFFNMPDDKLLIEPPLEAPLLTNS